jgi:hypothetical protein
MADKSHLNRLKQRLVTGNAAKVQEDSGVVQEPADPQKRPPAPRDESGPDDRPFRVSGAG